MRDFLNDDFFPYCRHAERQGYILLALFYAPIAFAMLYLALGR